MYDLYINYFSEFETKYCGKIDANQYLDLETLWSLDMNQCVGDMHISTLRRSQILDFCKKHKIELSDEITRDVKGGKCYFFAEVEINQKANF